MRCVYMFSRCTEVKHSVEHSPWHCCKNKRIDKRCTAVPSSSYPPSFTMYRRIALSLIAIYDRVHSLSFSLEGITRCVLKTRSVGSTGRGWEASKVLRLSSFFQDSLVNSTPKPVYSLSTLTISFETSRIPCQTIPDRKTDLKMQCKRQLDDVNFQGSFNAPFLRLDVSDLSQIGEVWPLQGQ